MASKTYVLDTSVILSEGKKILYSFGADDIVLPIAVLRELEKKRGDFELGFHARDILREIATLRSKGDISTGVSLGDGFGTLRIEVNNISLENLPHSISEFSHTDIRILAVAKALSLNLDTEVILVTKDLTLQCYADVSDVKTMSLDSENNSEADKWLQDVQTFQVTSEDIEYLYDKNFIELALDVPVNTGVVLRGPKEESALAIAKPGYRFELVSDQKIEKVSARSKEQHFAMKHLMDNSVGVVSLSGTAGSGKSFMMLAAALKLVQDKSTPYEKVIVFRPVNPVGGAPQELGYLPGTLDEKLAPHIKPIFDTLGTIYSGPEVAKIKRDNIIEFDAISHVRGRTLANCIVILDELQNVEKDVVRTLLSRLGINARVFVGWDIAQRDAKYIGKYDGIYRVVKTLLGHKLFAHVTLKKSERSPISQMVADLLE